MPAPLTQNQLTDIGKEVGFSGKFSDVGLSKNQTVSNESLGLPSNGTISSATLSGDIQSLSIPNVSQDNSSVDNIIQTAQSSSKSLTDSINQGVKDAQAAKESSGANLENTINQILGVQQSRPQLEQEAGLPELQKQSTELTNQIEARSRALENQVRAIESNPNLTLGQASVQSNEIRRKGAQELADLSIVLNATNRNFSIMQSIVDNKIKLQLEPLQAKLQFQEKFYEDNKELFTKAEERQFQNLINKENRNYKKEEDRITNLENARAEFLKSASSQGAPMEVLQAIQNAPDIASATIAAGQYGGDILAQQIKRAQLNKLQTDAKAAIASIADTPQGAGVLQQAQAKGNIDLIDELSQDVNLRAAVGPNVIARFSPIGRFSGGRSNFIAGIEQLRSNLNLEALIGAKARGATFGALSDQELRVLSNSATKIGSWAIKDKNGEVVGYNVSEINFKKELDKIQNFAKLDYLIKGGALEDIGAKQMQDGTVWVQNSDGSLTQLYP